MRKSDSFQPFKVEEDWILKEPENFTLRGKPMPQKKEDKISRLQSQGRDAWGE